MEIKSESFNKVPKFSIIMPTYNRANLLPRAVKSVLEQKYQNFELIIINDDSPDNTEEVIKSFNDKRIIHLKHEKNRGVYATENTGMSVATGEFITFLGDDDELYTDALESAFLKIKEYYPKGVKVFWFDSIDLDTGKVNSNRKEGGTISYEDLLCDRPRIDSLVVIDRNLFRQRRMIWMEERSWGDAGTLYLDFYTENPKNLPFYVPKVICKTRSMQGSHLSYPEASIKNIPGVIFAQNFFLNKYEKKLKKICPNRCGERLAMLGFYQILNGQKKEGRVSVLKSFKFKISLKYYFLFLISYILSNKGIRYLYVNFFKSKRLIKRSSIFIKKIVSR